MNIYLICNNLLANNVMYDKNMDIEEKKKNRPITTSGVEVSKKINLPGIINIYSSSYISCIETAKNLSEKCALNININKSLDDCVVGNLNKQSLKMLSYFQEHDFNYKLSGGESINEVYSRVDLIIKQIKSLNEDTAIFMPRRVILSYLTKYCLTGFNLDERLVLTYNDNIIIDSSEDAIEIYKLSFEEEEINIEKIILEEN